MEYEMQRKVKKGAKILRILSQIALWCTIVATGLALIFGVMLSIFPETFARLMGSSNEFMSIEVGILNYHVPSNLSYLEVLQIHQMMAFAIGISCALGALFLRQLVGILGEVENGRPFSPDNARRLGRMGILIIVSSIVYRIGQAAALSTVIHVAGLTDLSVNYTPDMDMIFIGILLFILAGIFKYGSYLQEEYDATL